MGIVRVAITCYIFLMREKNGQIDALAEALAQAGFLPAPDYTQGTIKLGALPEFKNKLAFTLTVTMERPFATQWDSLFEGCELVSGRILRGAAHTTGIYSRKKATERAKQEKWAAAWSLYDAGIIAEEPGGDYEKWEYVTLP